MKSRLIVIVACSIVLAAPRAARADDEHLLTPEARAAIERGLAFLANSPNPDGSWGDSHHAANTAVTLMAFMVTGQFPGRGPNGPNLDQAVHFLLETQREDGYFGGKQHGMYEHALATLALAEVWGESQRDDIREALIAGVELIVASQHESGGWRYEPKPDDADLSVTAMQIVALASAREAGVHVPAKTVDAARNYVLSCQHDDGGFRYQPKAHGTDFPRTAAGVMALMVTGSHDSPAVQRGMRFLQQNADAGIREAKYYYYAHYYAVQCMYQAGDRTYRDWYPRIRDALIARQADDGSWSGGKAGPAYSTAMSILVLGVPYRYLPIYQR
jgi:hypothetical protein